MKRTTLLLTLIVLLLGLAPVQAQYYGEAFGESEQLAVANTFQYALENNKSGTAATWNNPDSKHSGGTIPLRTFQTADGTYCREYQQLITIDGEEVQGYGTACRQPDGGWRIVAPDSVQEVKLVASQAVHVYQHRPDRYYDPWPYYYPYRYAYFPGSISFSFGYLHHDGHYSGGHHYGHGYKGHYRGYAKHRSKPHYNGHYRGKSKHHGKAQHKAHYRGGGKHNGKAQHKAHYRGGSKHSGKSQHKGHYRGGGKYSGKSQDKGSYRGHAKRGGHSQAKAFGGKRLQKARSWGHAKKAYGDKSVRVNKAGFKRFGKSGKGGRF